MDYLTDTTFLIDLWREHKKPGCATAFALAHSEAALGLPWIVKGEFLRGAILTGKSEAAVEFLSDLPVVWPTETTIRLYAETYAELRRRNQLIGPCDLWIAALARETDVGLIARNADEFRRVPDLTVVDYAH